MKFGVSIFYKHCYNKVVGGNCFTNFVEIKIFLLSFYTTNFLNFFAGYCLNMKLRISCYHVCNWKAAFTRGSAIGCPKVHYLPKKFAFQWINKFRSIIDSLGLEGWIFLPHSPPSKKKQRKLKIFFEINCFVVRQFLWQINMNIYKFYSIKRNNSSVSKSEYESIFYFYRG